MITVEPCILTINAGSSSLRFAIFAIADSPRAMLRGKIERIGLDGTCWSVSDSRSETQQTKPIVAANHQAAADYLLNWLESQPAISVVRAVAHRVVHGMTHSAPERVTPELLDGLRRRAGRSISTW